MPKQVRLAAIAMNACSGDFDAVVDLHRRAFDEAREKGASVVCAPELSLTTYNMEDDIISPFVQEEGLNNLFEVLPLTKDIVAGVGLPLLYRGALYNCYAICADGQLLGFVAKRNLAGDHLHYEPRNFRPWPEGVRSEIEVRGSRYPIGDLYFSVGSPRSGSVLIGVEICEDSWTLRRPADWLALRGAQVLLMPNASHYARGKEQSRFRLLDYATHTCHLAAVSSNWLGNQGGGGPLYDGMATVATQDQRSVGPMFSNRDLNVVVATADLERMAYERARTASFTPEVAPDERCVRYEDFVWPTEVPAADHRDEVAVTPRWMQSEDFDLEAACRGAGLGLLDYIRYSGADGVALALSGGSDSCATAYLLFAGVSFAVAELGIEGFREKFSQLTWMNEEITSVSDIMRHMLHCIYMPSSGKSSSVTENAARAVAEGVGATFMVENIDDLLAAETAMLERMRGTPLDWEDPQDNLTLQNLQARVRGKFIQNYAGMKTDERRWFLVIPPSNLSELIIGYFTQGGDDSGSGPNVIMSFFKSFLQELLRWACEEGPVDVGPFAALRTVLDQQPTAELQPLEMAQTDEGDLGSFEIRDFIAPRVITRRMAPLEVLEEAQAAFPKVSEQELRRVVREFFKRIPRTYWKLPRTCVGVHLGDENVSPEGYYRSTPLSRRYRRGLKALGEPS